MSPTVDRADNVSGGTEGEYEQTTRHRLGLWKWPVFVLGSALTLFQLYTAFYGNFVSLIQGAIHVGGAMGLIFLLYPAKKSWVSRRGAMAFDVALAAAALFTNFYIVFNYERLTTQAVITGFTTADYVVSLLGIALILEGTRRCVGLPIVVIACFALAYGIFGAYMPIFNHPGLSVERMATETYLTTSSIFGTPVQVSSTYIYLFLFFGVILVKTNIGQFFSDVAFAATGRSKGGTAKAAVVASGLQGMVSGSSVSNTVASGSFTIPMMKRAGFRPSFAGATEAAASTGGQILPPVMGAAAFIMAAFTGVAYNEIIILAAIPAVLYFIGVFSAVHFEAGKRGILGLPRSELPAVRGLLKQSYLFLPLVVIVGTLLIGRSPTFAALLGIGTALVAGSLSKKNRMSALEAVKILENGARVALPVIAAVATAGIIAGTVTKTGVGGKLAGGILEFAGGSLILVLIFTMVACLILGMGLPTTANYIVTATVAAPILVNNFDIPVIAAHMFVFYFGIVADITPPVCLAAYAGAGIAGANPMKTGVTAFKLAIGAFVIPFVFVSAPVLLLQNATISSFVPVAITALLGMIAISAGIMGHFLADANPVERLLLVAAGIMLVQPFLPVSMAGLVLLVVVGLVQRRRNRQGGQKVTSLSDLDGTPPPHPS